jgi:hypothetical protein
MLKADSKTFGTGFSKTGRDGVGTSTARNTGPGRGSRSNRPRPKRFYRHTSPAIAREIRDLYFARVKTQLQLAQCYGVAQATVSRYVSGQSWSR